MIKFVETLNSFGKIEYNQEMKNHTFMKVGGKVSAIIYPNDIEAVSIIIKQCLSNNINYKVMGRGSNCVFGSSDLEILIIKISNVLDELIIDDEYVHVGAGYSMQKLAKTLSKKGFMGLEFAGGIPGSVGGAIFMNAGAHLHSISDIVISVDCFTKDGDIKTLTKEECNFGYRSSIFQENGYIIIGCKLEIKIGDKAQIFKKMSGNLAYRKEMQPLEFPSCGSSFRNPPGEHAGRLIDECGLKGYRIGGVCVSQKHANFIVNDQNGTGEDVFELVNYVKEVVFEKTNIKLHTEMEFINLK